MKKAMTILMAIMMTLSLAACGGNTGTADPGSGTQQTEQVQSSDSRSEDENSSLKTYTVTVKDQDGNGVSGCVVNFCNASSCSPVTQDTDGVYTYSGEAYAYHIQIVKVPEGYQYDTSAEYTAEEAGGNIEVTITKE